MIEELNSATHNGHVWDSSKEEFGETAKKDEVERQKRLVAITEYQQKIRLLNDKYNRATTDEKRKEITEHVLSLPVPWLNGKTHLDVSNQNYNQTTSILSDESWYNSSSTLGMTPF